MKRISEFDNVDDFGFQSDLNPINLDSTVNSNSVNIENDGTTGKYFTLEDILSGGENTILSSELPTNDQAQLSIDTTIAKNLAFFGSVYSAIATYIDKVKSEYPNGFLIVDSVTGTNSIMFNNEDAYAYGGTFASITDYTNYELIQSYGGVLDQTFSIVSATTGGSFSVLYLDGQPSSGANYDHMIQPKNILLQKYYTNISKYELDLLVPPYSRVNYWPRDLVATNNILLEGSRYDDFLESELDSGLLSDNDETNILWRKLYPDGQKVLDSEDGIMQKLMLVYAANFDTIKRYQEHLKYQQTIGYEQTNHVSNDLVEILANQWNFALGHSLKQEDYSTFLFQTYDNYVTGQSQQAISQKDINFEIWRRVLANIVALYKKKGTKEAIKFIANIYSLPENLLWIDELVKVVDGDKLVIQESESNIVVPINGTMYYIDQSGNKKSLETNYIQNTKFLNVNVSPFDAIEFDYFDWGWENHPDVTGPNGTVQITGYSSEPSRTKFITDVVNKLIGSDGSSRYASKYEHLEKMKDVYYSGSVNRYTLASLEPYMNFLDANWNTVITNLIPSSSRLISNGNLYKNAFWDRQKYQWNDSELEGKDLPFNSGTSLQFIRPEISVSRKVSATIEIPNVDATQKQSHGVVIDISDQVAEMLKSYSTQFESISETGKSFETLYGLVDLNDPVAYYTEQLEDSQEVSSTSSGNVYTVDSPRFYPYSGQYGTLDYTNYTSTSILVTSQNTYDINFSASNLSNSGYTELKVELFKKAQDNPVFVDESKTFSILSVLNESDRYGTYKVSSTYPYEVGDWIKVQSNYLPFINDIVYVTNIDPTTNQIRTTPKIGLFQTPSGKENYTVDWVEIAKSSCISVLQAIYNYCRLSYKQMIDAIQIILSYEESSRSGTSNNDELRAYLSTVSSESYTYNIVVQLMQYNNSVLYGCILILEYLRYNTNLSINYNVINLISLVASNQTKATFNRIVDFFDWQNPIQVIEYTNLSGITTSENWILPTLNATARTLNNYSTSGMVTIGGLDDLNSEILLDKEEYFMRFKVTTHAPISFGEIYGLPEFTGSGGGTLIESNYDINYINNIKYYGNYFMHMKTPKTPNVIESPDYSATTDNSSVTIKWNGVGDSNRMEIELLSVSSFTQYSAYTAVPMTAWTTSAFTISVQAKESIDDDYVYTVQTTLYPDTYYWWRIKNFKSKLNMFGHNLEYYTATQPSVFKTGSFGDGGTNEGEIPVEPELPSGGSGKYSINIS